MKCQICGQQEATFHYIEVKDGQKSHQWICDECASREGTKNSINSLPPGNLESFLEGLSGQFEITMADDITEVESSENSLVCEACGYEFSQLQKSGLLGCTECYSGFSAQIQPILKRFHREVSHVGKAPRGLGTKAELRQKVASLRIALAQAVGREDYEAAAHLRDDISNAKECIQNENSELGPATTSDGLQDDESAPEV